MTRELAVLEDHGLVRLIEQARKLEVPGELATDIGGRALEKRAASRVATAEDPVEEAHESMLRGRHVRSPGIVLIHHAYTR